MVEYGSSRKFARSEHVDVVVREVTLTPDEGGDGIKYIEIREYFKTGELYGHGILIPYMQITDLVDAFNALGVLDS